MIFRWTLGYSCFLSGRDEQSGALRPGVRRERDDPDAANSRLRQHPIQVIVREAEPHVAHLLPVAFAVVRQHVADDDAATGLERARHVGDGFGRFRHMVQHQHHGGDVEPIIVDRQRFELAAAQIDVVEAGQPSLGGLQHRP